MKKDKEEKPSKEYDFLIKNGFDETVALEIDHYKQKKEKRSKRMERDKKEDKWK
jgi:hypothetical protein